jgi:iron complex transport system ATP-binding protein
MSLIEIIDADFDYGQESIFHDINLAIDKGEIFCLLGPNGCGKTTLLDCILGALRLKNGGILINGKDINTMKPSLLARSIAYVPQRHERTFPYSVLDMVVMGRAAYTGIFSSPSKEDRRIAEEVIERIGISELKHRPYTQLSGGEGQLVLIARALAQKTPVIVMDEPTAHLDFRHELLILETMRRLVRDEGKSVVMATHFPNHTFYFENNLLKTTVAMLFNGRFLVSGFPGQVLSEENIRKVYGIDASIISYNAEEEKPLRQIIPIKMSN